MPPGVGYGNNKVSKNGGDKKKKRRTGTQIFKATKTKRTGENSGVPGSGGTTSPKPVSRKRAKKAFAGNPKNFQKAYSAYKKTVKKNRKKIVKKEPN